MAELLGRQPSQVQSMLLRTSIVDRLNGELADLLAGRLGSEQMLLDWRRASPAGSQPYHVFPAPDGSRGHQRTPAWSISYSRGRRGSLSNTGGHGTDTVRDREAPGSNPGPRPIFELRNASLDA